MLNITSELPSTQCIINIKITNEIYYILFVILSLEILCIFYSYRTSAWWAQQLHVLTSDGQQRFRSLQTVANVQGVTLG